MVVEIPGFYYDSEKRRYFKIVPNHHRVSNINTSTSSNSTTTVSNGPDLPNYHIQRVREEKEKEKQLKNKQKKAKIKSLNIQNNFTLINDNLLNLEGINKKFNNIIRNKQIELKWLKFQKTKFRGVREICKINGNRDNTLVGFNNGYLKLINNNNNLELNFNLGHSQSSVSSINFINENIMICTQKGGERKSGSLHVLHYNQSNNTHEFKQLYQNSTPHSMLYNSCFNSRFIAIGCDKLVQLYNYKDSNINFQFKFNLNTKSIYSLKFDPFERDILFCGLRSGHLQLLDCRDRSYKIEFPPIHDVNYSIVDLFPLSCGGIGNQVITVGSDGTVLRLDLRKRGIYFPIKGHTADIQNPNFGTYLSADESILALAGKEGRVRFWDPLDGQLLIDSKAIQFPNMVKSLYSLDSNDFGRWMFCHSNLIQEYSSYNTSSFDY